MEKLSDDNPLLLMPAADTLLITAWQELGLFDSGGMGQAPLKWSEIKFYSDQSGRKLSSWESRQVRSMSEAYCSFAHLAENRLCQPPYRKWVGDEKEQVRKSVNDQLDKFDSMF